MNWYSGSITEAVAQSKVKNAIFVVYIEGQDEMSTNLTRHINDDRVRALLESNDFVAIKIDGNSQAYVQFMSIYKVVPIPSIFFIGNSGTPLDIGTGVIASAEELLRKIETVLVTAGKKSAPTAEAEPSASTASAAASLRSAAGDDSQTEDEDNNKKDAERKEKPAERQQSPPRTVNNAAPRTAVTSSAPRTAVTSAAPRTAVTSAAPRTAVTNAAPVVSVAETSAAAAARATLATTAPSATPATVDAAVTQPLPSLVLTESETRLAHVQKIIEDKRAKEREREAEKQKQQNERAKKENEIKLSETAQSWQRQQELRNLQESIRRDRLAAQEERDRIRAQIAADRAERAHASRAFESAASASTASLRLRASEPLAPASSIASSSSETRLQFRLPGGIQKTKAFSASDSLGTVRDYVQRELLTDLGVRDFILATTYPRRQFTLSDDIKTLAELNLIPNAIVLVLKMDTADRLTRTGGGFLHMVSAVLWAMITPAAKAFDYVSNLGFRNFANRMNNRLVALGWGWKRTTPDIVEIQADMRHRRHTDVFIAPATVAKDIPEHAVGSTVQPPNPGAVPVAEQPPPPPHPDAAPKRNYSGEATIHRLRDSVKDDDDKTTYNGNSTQQQ